MLKRLIATIILILVLALSGVGQEKENGRYLLVYTVKVPVPQTCKYIGTECIPVDFLEQEAHKWFQTHEEAIGWMNESNRVSKKMFVSLNFVVQLETVQEDGKWIIKP